MESKKQKASYKTVFLSKSKSKTICGIESEKNSIKIERPDTSEKVLYSSDLRHVRILPRKQKANIHTFRLYCQETNILHGGLLWVPEATHLVRCIATSLLTRSYGLVGSSQRPACCGITTQVALQRAMEMQNPTSEEFKMST